jgi:tetratricopeptide (TPR) repeat protein
VLHEKLGEGGMGAVYKATHRARGHAVALKLVSGDSPREASHISSNTALHKRLGLIREFQTLASLHHPNVVRVFGYGFDPALGPYFAMEILDEPETILSAERGSSVERKAELLADLLRAIGYLHRRGVIHRDIKPSNVLVSKGVVKVVDFGVALMSASATHVAGTIEYMAPELLRGEQPSESSDLYAAGIVAYELFAGAFPVGKNSMTRFVAGVLGTESDPTLPGGIAEIVAARQAREWAQSPAGGGSAANVFEETGLIWPESAEVPQALREVVEKLVAREQKDRYKRPEDVLADLGRAISTSLPIETAETRESFLTAARFVGREEELAELARGLDAAIRGQGSGFLLCGESGVGKSRLIAELRTTAMVRGCWVAEGQSLASGGAPYEEWLDVVRAMVLRAADVPDEEASILGEVIPDISALLGRSISSAEPTTADQAEDRLWSAIGSVLRRIDQPGLIIMEDLHWVRGESLSLLKRLSKLAPSLGLLVIGSYRSDEAPGLKDKLPDFKPLALQRLRQDAVRALSASMLGSMGEKEELVRYLHQQTEGNAFFVVEVVRALAEQAGSLTAIDQGKLPEGLFTLGLSNLVERRVDHISPAFRPLLELAAVLGRQIDEKVLAWAFEGADIEAFLIEGTGAAVLESVGAGFRFSHDKLREGIVARLSSDRCLELHELAAEALTATYTGAEAEARHAAIALHWAAAGQFEKAGEHHLAAAVYAMRLHIHADARQNLDAALTATSRALDTSENRARRFEALLRRAQISIITDPADENLARLAEAEGLITTLTGLDEGSIEHKRARVVFLRGRVYYYGGQPLKAIQCYREVLPAAQKFQDPELLALPSSMLGMALVTQGHSLRAGPLLKQALEPLLALGELHEYIRVRTFYGISLIASGRVEEGFQELEGANERADKMGQASALGIARVVRGAGHFYAWDYAAAERDFRDVLRFAEQSGAAVHRYLGSLLLAWTLSHVGKFDEATAAAAVADEVLKAMGGRLVIVDWFLALKAELAFFKGETDRALAEAEQVAATFGAQGAMLSTGIAERVRGLALGERDHSPEGIAAAELFIQKSVKMLSDAPFYCDAARTELFWALRLRSWGFKEQAEASYQRALEMLEKYGYQTALGEAARTWTAAT